jgi:UDP-2,4-diacetamido-2,4,6-trideoxy-beta-L-altropyranose hydrolase
MTPPTLLIRADATIAMGTGHVMRCIALAQVWQDAGGKVVFAVAEATPAIRQRLQSESFEVHVVAARPGDTKDVEDIVALAREQQAACVAVDGYQFGEGYQRQLKTAGLKVLFIDDYGHADSYSADFVLNQNVSANCEMYANRNEYTQLLVGSRYALLRREFAAWVNWERQDSQVCRRVLVMMGGSDPANLTARVMEGLKLAHLEDADATVLVGGSNPNISSLQKRANDSGLKINLQTDVTNPAELMAAADIAVSAAGSTCWELCLLGLPALLLDVAGNQTAVARELHRRGCAIHIGNWNATANQIAEGLRLLAGSQELRQSLNRKSLELVDGEGAARVVWALRGEKGLRLRRASFRDRRLLWEWANDPQVRAASFSPDPISWENHVAWFQKKLNPGSLAQSQILIAEDDRGNAVGQIRFDARADGEWEVDVSIEKEMRGHGFAKELIDKAVRNMELHKRIHALVKPANQASLKAFECAGFQRAEVQQVQGYEAIHLVFEKK